MRNKNQYKEPLIHITKKPSIEWWNAALIRASSIILALILCAFFIVLVTDLNPLEVYGAMIKGTFGTERKVWVSLQNTAILLCISIAVTPAFKMKFWNLGAEGQVLAGGLCTAACMICLGDKMPTSLLFIVMIASSIIAGIIWAVIPAFFKSRWDTNETLFTLMMNYVAMQLTSYFIIIWENPKGSSHVGIINSSSRVGWMPTIFGQKYMLNIIIVFAITIIMFVYLKYSKQGYEISVVGESVNTAKYIGINVKKIIIRTAALSGAICGLAGFLLVSGTNHTITPSTAGGQGFTAVMVSWLAKFNPLMMILVSFLIVFLEKGSGEIASTFRLNESIADIMTGIILFCIIGCEFFLNYKINFRKKSKEVK